MMQVERFEAESMAAAMQLVKRRFGDAAYILGTRDVSRRDWAFRWRERVEVMASADVPRQQPQPPARRPTPVMREVPKTPAPPAARMAHVRGDNIEVPRGPLPGGAPGAAALPPGSGLMQSPAVSNVTVLNLAQEVGSLRAELVTFVKEARLRGAPSVPEDLYEHWAKLIENEVADELAGDLVRQVQRNAGRGDVRGDAQQVRDKLADLVEKLIPTSGPIVRTKAVGPHVVALVGPTGVGKTTTLAKLAAQLGLVEGKRVGLITTDTFRIGAIDQLRKYSEYMSLKLVVVDRPEQMPAALDGLAGMDYVLVDTAGRSPNDQLKLAELKAHLDACAPDEVHLVLSATCGTRNAELAMRRFSDVRYDKVIFTKLDEATQLGVMLNVVRKVNKQLSYVTKGQNVPDDIEVGSAKRIARLIVCGTGALAG